MVKLYLELHCIVFVQRVGVSVHLCVQLCENHGLSDCKHLDKCAILGGPQKQMSYIGIMEVDAPVTPSSSGNKSVS